MYHHCGEVTVALQADECRLYSLLVSYEVDVLVDILEEPVVLCKLSGPLWPITWHSYFVRLFASLLEGK